MSGYKSRIEKCKPRNTKFVKTKIDELSISLDELLDPAPRQRKLSYHQALHMIKKFTYLIKDCNYLDNPES